MKRSARLTALLLTVAMVAPLYAQEVALPRWLAGCWQGEAGSAAAGGFEVWSAPRAEQMIGMSQTVGQRGRDFEFMRIERTGVGSDSGIDFVAQPGGKLPTRFRASAPAPMRLVFANPQHDFPKYIAYERDGDRLLATIGNAEPGQDGRRVRFEFRRVSCDTLLNP